MSRLRATPTAVGRTTATTELRAAGLSTDEIRVLKKARSPLAWLRPVLLLLGMLAIGSVVLMLAAYQFGKGTEELAANAAESRAPDTGERVLAGEGFDYTQWSEGVALFRIQADESRQNRDGTSYLTSVRVTVNHENGQTYEVKSRYATFREKDASGNFQARLEGDVVVSGWDKLVLEARALEFHRGGQVLESVGAVEFKFPPEYTGRASKLRVDRTTDTITLSEGVHLHTVAGAEQPMRLDCERLAYQRSTGILRAVGEASLKTDLQSLEAHYLTIFLAADGRTLESVRARWNVLGRLIDESPAGERTEIVYRGEYLDVQPDAGDPASRRIKLDGEGDQVTLSVTDLTGLRRSLTGLYLIGNARGNRLVQVEGVGRPIVLLESLDLPQAPFALRQVCAERLTARFLPGGGISRVQLEKRVELNDQGLSLSGGEEAALNMEDGSFRVEGEEVLLSNAQGEVTTKELNWIRDKGIIRAKNGVRAVLADRSLGALGNTPLALGSGPVQVESHEAYWTTEPPTFAFEGEVRAWRGESLLLAEQLLGAQRDRTLAASGGVRTVWTPAAGTSPAGNAARQPIEVAAGRVTYLDDGRRLVYYEDVEMHQGRRTIACQELGVALDAEGRAERMTCEDRVSMEDPESGRKVEGGDRAVYTPAADLVEIFGEKVELYDADNTRMQGKYVRYDMRTGTFKIRSSAAGAEVGSP